jgi:hemoglobin
VRTFRSTALVAITAGILISGLTAAEPDKSLYERLGGMPAVTAVVGDLVDRILVDNRVNKWFAHAASSPENTHAYKATLTNFVCQNVGGPCKYTGPDMSVVHKGRGVTSEAFDAVVQDLIASLEKFKVPEKEKHDLLAILGPLKSSIVQK